MKILFMCSGMRERLRPSVETSESDDEYKNAREVTMKVKSGYVVQYIINGTMKTVFHEQFFSSRFVIKLY